MRPIAARLQAARNRIADAAHHAGRDPAGVELLAISKTWSADVLREAFGAGQRNFGESYAQEALAKIRELADLPLTWHFVGPIQSNKTRSIAEHFAWVHSVERLNIAERLSNARPTHLAPLQVCIQINVSGEASKSGAATETALDLARGVAALSGLNLRGLMTIPRPAANVEEQRNQFATLRELKNELTRNGLQLDTLSMGMSDDLEAAIAEGATMVRVGTAIFGKRAPR